MDPRDFDSADEWLIAENMKIDALFSLKLKHMMLIHS